MIAEILSKMTEYSGGNLHDIHHFLKVWAWAKTIGELEGLDEATQQTLEAAAIVHDIACPVLRLAIGSCPGKEQEAEGMPLARELLSGMGLTDAQLERAVFLVGHHHTVTGVDGADWQILLEADYIANAAEGKWPAEALLTARKVLFRTASGKKLLNSIFQLEQEDTQE